MTQRWVIPVLVALAFAAGFAARMWTERERLPTLPPPPTPGTEFVRTSSVTPEPVQPPASTPSAINRAKLISEIENVRPHVDVYRAQMEEIGKEFDRAFYELLNEKQRAHWDKRQKMHAKNRAKREQQEASGTPLTDPQIEKLRREPLWNALWNVAINWRLDFLCKEYKLDEDQRGAACGLLKTRREKFLALVDSTPPPTISYSELARQAQKLAEPKN